MYFSSKNLVSLSYYFSVWGRAQQWRRGRREALSTGIPTTGQLRTCIVSGKWLQQARRTCWFLNISLSFIIYLHELINVVLFSYLSTSVIQYILCSFLIYRHELINLMLFSYLRELNNKVCVIFLSTYISNIYHLTYVDR